MSREMKQSGIPWIGDIPKGWNIDTIGNLYTLRNEKVSDKDYPPLSVTKMGIVPQLETAAKTDDGDNRKLVRIGDFAINSRSDRRGSCGISAYDGSVSLINTVITPREQMNPRFYNWLFHSELFADEFYKWGHGIVDDLWTTRWQEMKRISIVAPSLSEQQKIASFLDRKCSEIDEMIALQEKIVEELKAYKQSKVKELFDTYMATEPFTILKLGAMASLVTKQTGFDYSNTISHALVGELSENTIPYLQTKHFKDGYWNYNTDYYIPKDVAVRFPKILLNKKSLLFSIVGASIGNVAVFPATTTAFLGGAICKVDLIKERDYEYIKHFMMSIYGQEQISSKINSSAQGTITVQNVRDFKIPMFDNPNVQNAITEEVSLLGDRISSLIAIKLSKIDSLKEYKKSIIYEYVTGKKEVKE